VVNVLLVTCFTSYFVCTRLLYFGTRK